MKKNVLTSDWAVKKQCNVTPESATTSLKRLKLKVNGLFPVILIHGIVVIITNDVDKWVLIAKMY